MKTQTIRVLFFLIIYFTFSNLCAQIPQTPYLISPPDGATNVSLTPTLDWSTVVPHVTYLLKIEQSGQPEFIEYNVSTSEYTIDEIWLMNGSKYRWRVQAYNNYGRSDWSNSREFTCAELGTPTLLSPPDGATGVSLHPTFTWSETQGAVSYDLRILFADFRLIFHAGSSTSISATASSLVFYNYQYEWYITAHGNPNSTDSEHWYYTTESDPSLVAGFYGSPTSGNAPLAVQFTDQSSGDITSRSWDFGDGETSTSTNPSHTYQNPGTYTVTLTIAGLWGGSNTKTRTDYITVSAESTPIAYFSASPTSGIAPLTVQFTDQSTGNITSRSWDFGNGETSTSTNPSHTYQNTGSYTVVLTVTGPGGSDTKTRTDYITVSAESIPIANFSASPTSGIAPLTVQFTDQSSGNINSREWNFGDGETSTATNPSHIYQHPDTFTVKLTVTGPAGSDSKTRSNYITVFPYSDNILLNGGFSGGTNYWDLFVSESAQAAGSVSNGEYVISITNGGNYGWEVHLQQSNLLIETDSTYYLSFDAYAETAREITPFVAMNSDPWTIYGYQVVTLDTVKQTFTNTFTMQEPIDPNARIAFDVGASTVDCYLDNVFLTKRKLSSANMLYNGELSLGGCGWNFVVYSPAEASGLVQNGEYTISITNDGNNAWDVHLEQSMVLIENGKTYNVSFDAYAESPRTIIPFVGMNSDPWTCYGGYQSVTLGTTKQSYSYTFTMNHPTDPDARLAFEIGTSDVNVYLDNIVCEDMFTSVEERTENTGITESFILHQNYPNPFNPFTNIEYDVKEPCKVNLIVYNLNGQVVKELVNSYQQPGTYSINLNMQDIPSGIYFYKIQMGNSQAVKKMVKME